MPAFCTADDLQRGNNHRFVTEMKFIAAGGHDIIELQYWQMCPANCPEIGRNPRDTLKLRGSGRGFSEVQT